MTAPTEESVPPTAPSNDLSVRLDMGLIAPIPGFNSRQDLGDVSALAETIKEKGQISPIVVLAVDGLSEEEKASCQLPKGKRFGIVAGYRRHAAIDSLGWGSIEAKILPSDLSLKDAQIFNLIENVQREDLTTFETATTCAELNERYGMSGQSIATHLGKSKSYVNNLLKCRTKLDPAILKAWEEGDADAIVDYLVVVAKQPPEKQVAMWADKKGLGESSANGEGSAEESDGKWGEEPKPEKKRKPSAAKVEYLASFLKESVPEADMRRFALSLIKVMLGEQFTVKVPGKGGAKFDIREKPTPAAEE